MLTSTDYLSLLQITRWIPRPIVPASWVAVKNRVILFETQSWFGKLSLQEGELFQAILKAFSLPEETLKNIRLFKLEAGIAQFDFTPTALWVWGEVLGRHLLNQDKNVYPCPIQISPGLKNLLKDPIHKRKLWNDGRHIFSFIKPR